MVANGMPVLWITINPADLRCPLVIRLAGVKHELSSKIQSTFHCKTATINPVAVAKFFNIICNVVFILLFAAGQIERGLLGPISNYFATIKTNGRGMLHLHYLVWLKGVSYLATLQFQI